jgi:hypothetical protein
MAIVVYKCDVCKRDIELEQNLKGLENIQRCTITHGCRGKLYQTKVLPDFVRGRLPDQVAGLDDWRQRKVLYNHKQTIERENWAVKHDLGTFPSVSVFVNVPTEADPDNQEEIIPTDIVIVDEDNLILKFDKALSGLAQLVARQSDPDLLRPFVGLNISVEDLQQISLTGDIAIATRISTIGENDAVGLDVEYTTTTNAVITHSYNDVNLNELDTNSSWQDIDRVIVKGKTYTVRSFNALIPEMSTETIGSGSTFKFTNIATNGGSPIGTARPIEQDEVLVLFASSPFDSIDKITTQYIDVYDVIASTNNFNFVYDTGEFFADTEIIQDTYPPIRSVQI